jgi:hypothetical protein
MFTAKGKKRAASLTGSTVIIAITTILTKNIFPRVTEPNTFSGDRKKFKIYESQYRIYLWADGKKEK